jgi:hypothetical protein
MPPSAAAVVVALALFAHGPPLLAAAADGPDLDWVDRDALQAREIQIRTGKDGPLVVTADAAVRIDAEPQAIWDVLTACSVAPEYVPNVVSCRLIETADDGLSQLFVQTVKPAFFLPSFEHVFRLSYEPYTRIDVNRVSGPIEQMDATWWLLPQSGGWVLAVYSLKVNPGLPVPRFFVRATLKRDLPKVLGAIRERAEAAR